MSASPEKLGTCLPRTVGVFLSSTFQDMHAERDCLVRRVIPRFEEWLATYRMRVRCVDLRWGITREEAENGRVLDLCLQEIERCRPFFVGLLGQRYGWVPPRISEASCRTLGLPAEKVDRSITEMEILHGVLLSPAAQGRALFCYRDADSLRGMNPTIRSAYEDSDPANVRRLAGLKERIEASGCAIVRYCPAWDEGKALHGSEHAGAFGGLEDFEESVFQWLCQAVTDEYRLQDGPFAEGSNPSALATELYMDSRLEGYVARSNVESLCLNLLEHPLRGPAFIVGGPGSGKSSAMSWLVRHVESRTGWMVVPFFAGVSPEHAHLAQLLSAWIRGLGGHLPATDDVNTLATCLADALRDFPSDRRALLIADGLDVLDPQDQVCQLSWLPDAIPDNVRIVFSVRHSSSAPHPCVRQAEAAGNHCACLPQLTADECAAILDALPELSAKTLDTEQRELLLSNPATRNPLYLCTALSELKGHGRFETLNARIRSLPKPDTRNADNPDPLLTALFQQIVGRIAVEFQAQVVRPLLTALACCRNGMAPRELVALCGVESADEVHAVIRHLRDYTMASPAGIALRHRAFSDAVLSEFVGDDGDLRAIHERLATLFEDILPADSRRRAGEAAWHHFQAGNHRLLARAILRPFVLNCLWKSEMGSLPRYWSAAKDAGFDMVHWTLHAVEKHKTEHTFVYRAALMLQSLGHLGEFFTVINYLPKEQGDGARESASELLNSEALTLIKGGHHESAMSKLQEAEELAAGNEASLASVWGNLALIHAYRQEWDHAIPLILKQERACRNLRLNKVLCACLGNLAYAYGECGRHDEAEALLHEKERLCEAEGYLIELQMCHGQWAQFHERRGDHEAALKSVSEKERICRENGLRGDLDNSLMFKAGILSRMDRVQEALALVEEVSRHLDQRPNPIELVEAHALRAELLARLDDRLDDAIFSIQRAIRIGDEINYPGKLRLLQIQSQFWERQKVGQRAGDDKSYAAMLDAAENNNLSAIQRLHAEGCPLEAAGKITPLHYACRNGYTEVADWLISVGAGISPLFMGGTPLDNAIGGGHEDTFRLMLDRGASVGRVEGAERPPLVQAAFSGRVAMVKTLLERGADIEAFDLGEEDGKNALMYAAKYSHAEVVRALLAAGANPNARNRVNRRTAMMYACGADNTNIEIIRMLLDVGGDPFLVCSNGHAASYVARSQAVLDLLNDWRPTPEWGNACLNRDYPEIIVNETAHRVLDSAAAFVVAWKKDIPAAYPFAAHDAVQSMAEVVDAAKHMQESAQRIFDPGCWRCQACGTVVPADAVTLAVGQHYPYAEDFEDSKPSGQSDPEQVQAFLERRCCLACNGDTFAVFNTTGQSEDARSDDLLCDPGFMAFMIQTLKSLESWPSGLDEDRFATLRIPDLIAWVEAMASKKIEWSDEGSDPKPAYIEDGANWMRTSESRFDRLLIERLSDKAQYGHPIADANSVIERAVAACAGTVEARCLFLGIPFIWYKNTGHGDADIATLQKKQHIAIENLLFALAGSRDSVRTDDVRILIEEMLRGAAPGHDDRKRNGPIAKPPSEDVGKSPSPPADDNHHDVKEPAHINQSVDESVSSRGAGLGPDADVNVNAPDGEGKTPLMHAIGNRLFDEALSLVARGARATDADRDGWTPLHILAAMTGVFGGTEEDEQLARCLLEAGGDVNARNKNGDTALMIACAKANERLVRVLMEHGADPDMQASDGSRAVDFAETDEIRNLVAGHRPLSPNERLLAAARNGDVQSATGAIADGAEVNTKTPQGETSAWIAAERGNADLLDNLIMSGADLDLSDETRRTPLIVAARGGHGEVVKRLLAENVDINRQDNLGATALHGAAINGHAEIVAALLKAGADRTVKNRLGYTARQVAEMNGLGEVVAVFDGSFIRPRTSTDTLTTETSMGDAKPDEVAYPAANPADQSGKTKAGVDNNVMQKTGKTEGHYYPWKQDLSVCLGAMDALALFGLIIFTLPFAASILVLIGSVLDGRYHVDDLYLLFGWFLVAMPGLSWAFLPKILHAFGRWGVCLHSDRMTVPLSLRRRRTLRFDQISSVRMTDPGGIVIQVDIFRKGYRKPIRLEPDVFRDECLWKCFCDDVRSELNDKVHNMYTGRKHDDRQGCAPKKQRKGNKKRKGQRMSVDARKAGAASKKMPDAIHPKKKKDLKPSFGSLRSILLYSDSLDAKIDAVHKLAVIGSPEAMGEVLETLKDPDGEMTLHASLALATYGERAITSLNESLQTWGTTGMHPSRMTPLNLRERLLYPAALLGERGAAILRKALNNEDDTVRNSAADLLAVIQEPIRLDNDHITISRVCEHCGWGLSHDQMTVAKPISLRAGTVHPRILSVIAVLCGHQGLFGTGLRGKHPISQFYDLTSHSVACRGSEG